MRLADWVWAGELPANAAGAVQSHVSHLAPGCASTSTPGADLQPGRTFVQPRVASAHAAGGQRDDWPAVAGHRGQGQVAGTRRHLGLVASDAPEVLIRAETHGQAVSRPFA